MLLHKLLSVVGLTGAGAGLVMATYRHQELLAAILAVLLAAYVVRTGVKSRAARPALEQAFVIVTTGVIGYLTESWGTMLGHWTYHDLPPGQHVPLWVPLAWSAAGELLHQIEKALPPTLSPLKRIGAAYALGMALPLFGESLCVAFGVWTYAWPVQILGIPLAALALISYAHLTFGCIRAGVARSSRALPVPIRASCAND